MKAPFLAVLICGTMVLLSTPTGKSQNPESRANGSSASGRENKNAQVYAELDKAPQKARVRANPLELDPDAIAAGRLLFEDHCAECHGEKLRSSGAVPDLRKMPADARAIFDETVKNGRGQMPSWEGQLTDENFDQIWAYIRSRAQ